MQLSSYLNQWDLRLELIELLEQEMLLTVPREIVDCITIIHFHVLLISFLSTCSMKEFVFSVFYGIFYRIMSTNLKYFHWEIKFEFLH